MIRLRHRPPAILRWALAASALVVAVASSVSPAQAHPVAPVESCALDRGGEEAVYNGTDTTRQLAAYSPFRVVKYPCARSAGSRALLVGPGSIELVQDGRLHRRVALARSREPITFERIARAVGDPAWIAEVEPGVFEVATAMVQAPGTSISFAAPGVRVIRLLDRPDVFIGGRGAAARFEGVTVTSWDADRGGPDEELSDGRPFVLYDDGGRLDIVDSRMTSLGSDRSGGAYGVAWRKAGITGEVLRSTFDHNFFGVYTYEAGGIVFRNNVFRDNLVYGFDPHDFTAGLVVEGNEAYGNGNHGFILSRYVVDSVMRDNHAYGNGGSGIVLDFESDRNLVENNLVEENGGDGIVLLGSADNVVAGNVVRNNRVGIRVNHESSRNNHVRDNVIVGNQDGLQAYGGAADLLVTGNHIYDTGGTAMLLDAARAVVRGGAVRGADRGLVIQTATEVSGLTVSDVDEGVIVAPTGFARLEGVTVDARQRSLRIDGEGFIEVNGSLLQPAPPGTKLGEGSSMAWLPLAGIGAVTMAVVLEVLRWVRERRDVPSPAPAGVWNRA